MGKLMILTTKKLYFTITSITYHISMVQRTKLQTLDANLTKSGIYS